MLTDNLAAVRAAIAAACRECGRSPEEITLVAVSKTKPAEDILTAYEAGQRDFGENYAQELKAKHEALPKDIRWHMIGHLQRNKVKYIAPFVEMIHSVDTPELARMIDKEAAKCGRVIPVMVEVNVGREPTKYGVTPEEAPALVDEIRKLPHISYKGLMTSAPYVEDPETDRPIFRDLRELSVDISLKNLNNEKDSGLSMGMSNDFRIAIEEGATYIRVGEKIFGARNYNK